MQEKINRSVYVAIAVAALGYFVDIYDLLLFSIVRVQSLSSLGFSGDALLKNGLFLLNVQMIGMLIGGIVWGMLGDKRGRLAVLFGSIFVYSVANIANAFVHSIEAYAGWRFIAGFGLAGELGAGITLVSETLPVRYRGYGTTVVAAVGVAGAVAASLIGGIYDWRVSYFIGGVLGLLLFLLRLGVFESGLYRSLKSDIARGSLLYLLKSSDRFQRYISCILSGIVLWFVVGILITFAPEFGSAFEMQFKPTAGSAVMWCYAGLVFGDIASGLISQALKSRRKVLRYFTLLTAGMIAIFLTLYKPSLFEFYSVCFCLGFSVGFWAVFITTASEQFGTNLRATVTTTVPNFVRGGVVPVTWAFQALKEPLGIIEAAWYIGIALILLGLIAINTLRESFATDLDFVD